MTAAREAIALPLMLLTVAGLGGLRVGHTVVLIPPPLVSLVLALMLVGALVRAGVFAPHSLHERPRVRRSRTSPASRCSSR